MNPLMLVIGVRSSWLTVATNSLFACSCLRVQEVRRRDVGQGARSRHVAGVEIPPADRR